MYYVFLITNPPKIIWYIFVSIIRFKNFKFVTTLPFNYELELLKQFKYLVLYLDKVSPYFSSMIINKYEKNIYWHQWNQLASVYTHPKIQHIKVTLCFTTCILVVFSLMLLHPHTFFTYFSRYVDQWRQCHHSILLQSIEIPIINMSKHTVPYPLFLTSRCKNIPMLQNLQLNLQISTGSHMIL